MRKQIKLWILVVAGSATMYACSTSNQYKREEAAVTNNYYRTDKLPADSVSSAEISWKQIFTDPYLQKHIDTALQNNIDIRVALENIKIAGAYAKQARASFYPTLSVAPGVTYSTTSLNTQFGQFIGERAHIFQYDLTLSTSWEADVWGKLKDAKKSALLQYLQAGASHQAVKSRIVAGIASLYYELLALDEQKQIIEKTIASREANLEATKALKEAGSVTEVAVIQTDAQLTSAKAQLLTVQNGILVIENQIRLLQGLPPGPIERGTFGEQVLTDELKVGYPVSLLSNRPDVMMAEYGLMSAYRQTNVARKSMYPSLRITGSAGLQSVDIEKFLDANSLFANVVGQLAQPIVNQRRLKTQLEVAQRQQEIARLNFTATLLNAGREVSDALNKVETYKAVANLKSQESESYLKAVTYSNELLNYGLANYLEVLRAEENALNARLAQVSAELNMMNAVVQLYLSLGGGWR